jgi:hypothetical protein
MDTIVIIFIDKKKRDFGNVLEKVKVTLSG